MNPLISVIIPVYNTAQYLNQCIESVRHQTVENLQIILVDDGATDNSPQMCDEWAKKDSRIQVIHKKNEGLGLTRNAGLNVALGQYVSFLDSDDTLDSNTYERCITRMEELGAKACYFGRKTMDKDGKMHLNPNIPDKLVFRGNEVKAEFAKRYFGLLPAEEKVPYIQASSCCVLYKRDIIEENQIRFCSEREYLSEDRFFNLDICKAADCVCILPEDFYNYTYNAGSLTKKRNHTKFARCKLLYQKLAEYTVDFPEIADVQPRIQSLFVGYTRMIMKEDIAAITSCGFKEVYQAVKATCADEMVQQIYRQISKDLFDKNSRIYMNWVLKKRVLLLIFYYTIIKR